MQNSAVSLNAMGISLRDCYGIGAKNANFWSVSLGVVLLEMCKMHNKKLIAAFFIVVQKSLFF